MRPVKKHAKKVMAAVAAAALTVSGVFPSVSLHSSERAYAAGTETPYLLITEIVFNTPNVSGGDVPAWEYIEIYNNSNKTIPLDQYSISYQDLSGNPVRAWTFKDAKTLQPGKTMVLRAYVDDENGTLGKFNEAYKVNPPLTEAQELLFTGSGNLENAPGRTVSIVSNTGETIVSAKYNEGGSNADDKNNTSVTYAVNESGGLTMRKLQSKTVPTPGSVLPEQIPSSVVELPDDFLKPIISHTLPIGSTTPEDLTISAEVRDDQKVEEVKLYYKKAESAEYAVLPMSKGEGDSYQAVIPAEAMQDTAKLQYYMEASDGTNVSRSPAQVPYEILVFDSIKPIDTELLITELVPDSKGADAYEYIEVYNNTNRAVNLKDYQIIYEFRHGATTKWDIDRDLTVPSKGTAVVWVQSLISKGKPASDFIAHYGAGLAESSVVPIFSNGMPNAEEGRIHIAADAANPVHHAGDVISQAWFSVAADEVNDDGTSIVYEYPKDGTNRMFKRSIMQPATPGALLAGQVPAEPVKLPADKAKPNINHDVFTEPQPFGDLQLQTKAKDNQGIKQVQLHYKRDGESGYHTVNMPSSANDPDLYISDPVIKETFLHAAYIDYYFTATDGFQTASTLDGGKEPYRLEYAKNEQGPLWFNNPEGSFLSGTQVIQGNAETPGSALSLKLDGQAVSVQPTMPEDAYILFEADDMQVSFKNGLFVNGELASLLPAGSYYELKAVPLPMHMLKPGVNTVKLTAGNGQSPTGLDGNNDDYRIQNVRIALWNGAWQEIASARGKKLNVEEFVTIQPADRTSVGDSANNVEYVEYTIDLPESLFQGVYHELDTTQLTDGEHSFELSSGDSAKKTVKLIVDNTAPSVDNLTIKEGQTYRGAIELNADVTDAVSGVASVEATLDGKAVTLPFTQQAAELAAGEHLFRIEAKDAAGNEKEAEVRFNTENEHPDQPSEPSPADNASNVGRNADLSVKVTDPNGDPMDVTFYEAYQYDFSGTNSIDAYSNSVDREPPLELAPAGETAFGAEEKAKVKENDGQYYVTDSEGQFPYHRFDFKLDKAPADSDEVEVVWEGHSLPDRQVTMYVWNFASGKWEPVDSGIGAEDFQLKAKVNAGETVRGNKLHVLIQDLLPSPDDVDFTFAWVSDTQYYSDSYPEIYKGMMNYIAEQKEEMKIVYSIHTGDIVDDWDRPDEWKVASDSMKILEDAKIPYGVVAGNHDVHHDEGDYTEYYKYFGRDRFESQPTYGGDHKNNRDHYDLVSSHGQDFLIMYLGWNIQEDTIKWANEVLAKHPNRYVILATHEYISPSKTYSGQGQQIWTDIVAPNDNVFMVLSGHLHGVAYDVKHVGGRAVVEMLADYQSGREGGQGYMRFLQFDLDNDQIHVDTYSAYMDDYNYFDEPGLDEFDIDYPARDASKQVATDYIGLNVYTRNEIGTSKDVASGSKASAAWNGLSLDRTYYWYADAKDANGGRAVSDIWSFATGMNANASSGSGRKDTDKGDDIN
ncbi:lamin tail domain-containing protein [Paenibacillus sp. N4]|uniref:lamin tail domain-containing protein n=1 Tax=Paenibacillus vietnamensis TaxID=2590547 RepID=UPI001CD0975E|nr:lamin tail domain-containing protein [Paenibacillus vietnamensis]MCA0754738.1 lamin tail domain-containing protein [Paenibacillus vietnamensis]